jgi:hypothetical protein
MRLLTHRTLADRAAGPSALAGQLATVAALTGLGIGLGLAVGGGTGLERGVGLAFARGAVHAGFLSSGWVLALEGQGGWPGPALRGACAMMVASLVARISLGGAAAYLLVPLVIARDATTRRFHLERIGWCAPRAPRALATGAATGIFLGIHLLFAASLMLGYPVAVPDWRRYLAAVAYDLGANALTAEWLFRGAIFSALWRRWSFWPAAGASTALALLRYLLDPALPQTAELVAGAMFYMLLLGLACCALRAWSGSLVPGYLATAAFFAAYRVLLV